jgi:Fe-S cluster biogenesis protein NfuA
MEGVPNPNAMKFVLENGILTEQPYEFTSYAAAADAPLAKKLLMLRFVDRVLIYYNHITVLKNPRNSPSWDEVVPQIRGIIQEHLSNDEPIIYVGVEARGHQLHDDVVAEMARNILDRGVRPAAQADGGDILFERFHDGVLEVSMHGACHECPYVHQTIKQGVEPMMMQLLPEVKSVKPIFIL